MNRPKDAIARTRLTADEDSGRRSISHCGAGSFAPETTSSAIGPLGNFLRRALGLAGCLVSLSVLNAATESPSGVATDGVMPSADTFSIARVWNEEALAAIRLDSPHPPVQARNLFHLSVAMYDAWAAYDPTASGYLFHQKIGPNPSDPVERSRARRQAISQAAYRILKERVAYSRSAAKSSAALDARMVALGYPTHPQATTPTSPAGVGNAVYQLVSSFFFRDDGCFQENAYDDLPKERGGYVPVNPVLVTGLSGTTVVDVNRWQPLAIANAADQNGFPASPIQKFQGSQWLGVRPFGLRRNDESQPWINPGPPPRLGGVGDPQFREEIIGVIRHSSQLTPDDGVVIDISPGALGNNTLGKNDGAGHFINPATAMPYPPHRVRRGDFGRVLAEFWADGPHSETPPGHWNVIANSVADSPGFHRRLGGTGETLDRLEWDVKVYFALNAALHDAACAAWSLKRYYDGGRPMTFIRYMGMRGQSSDPKAPAYHPEGLPLVPDLVELVTQETSTPGGRHAGLPVGRLAVLSWPGQPVDPTNQFSGVRWILPENWVPYQKATFVTPAFPGYISGHSTFSRSAAEVMAAVTGNPFFPGGLGTYSVSSNALLTFEKGPSQKVELQWATYFDAADQAGISRLWGGIHVSVDDLTGRKVGSACGRGAWDLARRYFDGSVSQEPITATATHFAENRFEIRAQALRGFSYALESADSVTEPFRKAPSGFQQARNSVLSQAVSPANRTRYYRWVRSPHPIPSPRPATATFSAP